MATTTNQGWTLPTVGASEDAWGDDLNANWTALDALLGGTNATEFAILDGATLTTAELNKLAGLATTAAELGYVNGVTSAIQTQLDAKALASALPSGAVVGTTDTQTLSAKTLTSPVINTGVSGTALSSQALAEAGADNATIMTPLRTKQAIDALGGGVTTAQVNAAMVGITVGDVGTLAFLCEPSSNQSQILPGGTLAGSSLRYAVASEFTAYGSASPSGTWRLLGGYSATATENDYPASLWVRIA